MGAAVPKGTVPPERCGAGVSEHTVEVVDVEGDELGAAWSLVPDELQPVSVTAAAQAVAASMLGG